MPFSREPSGGAALLDAVLYGDIWVLLVSESPARAQMSPPDPFRTWGDDQPSPGPG
jgi:hypothetical protein